MAKKAIPTIRRWQDLFTADSSHAARFIASNALTTSGTASGLLEGSKQGPGIVEELGEDARFRTVTGPEGM